MGTPIFLLLLLSPGALGLMVARCPEGWRARGGTNQCYRVHSYGSDRTFNDARIYCQARGGDLANIDSTALRDWLGQLVGATGNIDQYAYMWVGAKNVDGTWKWIETDKPIDNLVIEWEGNGLGECAALTINSKLIKQDCSQQLKFICHRNIEIPMACDYTSGWEDAGDRCYKKSSTVNSWHDAEVECVIEGGHLTTVGDDSEQQLAHDLALEERDKVWIGYTEEGHPGEFKWVDGSNSNKTYWHEGQPDTSLNGFGAAVVDNDDPSGLWVVEKITNEFHYLCEKPTGSCLPGWKEFEKSCYYFNTENADLKVWQDAKSTCEAVNARMVVLDTEAEDVFFRNHMPESATLWIGLYSKSKDDIYWTDGTLMTSKNFTHMSEADKTNAIANEVQQCAYLEESTDIDGVAQVSSWVPTDCFLPRPYACEADVGAQLTLVPPSNERYCPDGGWVQQGDHCYLFSAEEMTWTDAKKACNRKHSNADLVSILTWGEQDYVFAQQLAGGWIGLNKMDQGFKWEWSDGSATTVVNWEFGEPNGDEENCVEMYMTTGKWNDMFCSDMRTYSCKMPASTSPIGPITTTTAIPDTSACGYDWTENPTTGECYRVEVLERNYKDARLHCHELHYEEGQTRPELVSIASAEEETFVFSLVVSQHLSQSSIWIGMMNELDENFWVDGTPSAYFNFEDGEPNSYWDGDCIEMYTSSGKWNDAECSVRSPFICEKKGRNYVAPLPPPRPIDECPSGWSYWDNNCYYFSADSADWFTAETNCQDMLGSHLVSITNKDENDYVTETLEDMMTVYAWLGLRDDDNGNNWHWVDGTLFDWTNWGSEEPNNSNGEEHCAELQLSSWETAYLGQWNDVICSKTMTYVCKMSARTCPLNWAYNDGKCYYVSDYEASRNEGEVKCQEVNKKATLVNIHSQEENQFFMEQLQQSSSSCWLGLQYDGANWTWSDGTTLEYSNWNYGEPNNLEQEACGEMIDYPNGEPNGKWNNLACGDSRAFGCEMYPTHMVGCEDGWEMFGDYCYYWHSGVNYDYEVAKSWCKDRGAEMASVHSAEENDFVFSLQITYSCTHIGFTDKGHQMFFEWDDGTPMVYVRIESFMGYMLPSSRRCGCYSYYDDGTLTLGSCTNVETFVCKKPAEAIPLNPVDTGCDKHDIYHEASCYHSPELSASWEDAKKDCESLGRHLVVLEDQFETAFLSSALIGTGVRSWLGLSGTIASDGSVTFAWVNEAPTDYTYWAKYEPDTEYGTCVAASGENNGLWGVRSCDDKFLYMCEYDRVGYTAPPPPTTKAPSDYCIYGWEHKGFSCYKVMQNASMWGEAEAKCGLFGGHLVSVKDELEQTLILGLTGMKEIVEKYGNVWVGLVMGEQSGYEWTDGTGVDFVNWAEGQPESNGGRESCVSGDASTLKLSDSVCQTHLPYVCEAATGSMLTTAIVPTTPPLHPCPDNPSWYKFNDHCYKFTSSTEEPGQTWWGAHKRCRDEGGELASIATNDENYWIESMIYNKAGQGMWIGGRAKLGTGYDWLDGEPFIYNNWAAGEPNNVHDQEDCIVMYTNNQGYWNDQNCGLTAGRVCKRPSGVTLPPPKTTKVPDGHCPEGWLHTGTKCVYFIMDRQNFTTSRKVCQTLGKKMDLASVHSASEQAYLTAAMVTLDQHMWIGMRYELGFYWVDQTAVSYTNWGANEPNGGAGKEECVEVSSETGMWNDISCDDEFGAVCMMTQDPTLPDHHTPDKCPSPHSNYLAYNGACYRVVNNPQTWQDAEATCSGEDAHLVSIMTIAQDDFVWAAAQQSGFKSLWTGLMNKENLKTFEWSDGWPTVYTNWGDNEPVLDSLAHKCVIMNVTGGSWYTKPCDQTHTFICKYTNVTAPTPDPPVTGRCPDSRWKDLKGGYCYLFSNDTQTWDEANRKCIYEESQLVSVHSKGEMTLMTLHMQGYTEPFWIGLYESSNGEKWTDGTSVNFVNWQNGEPNSESEKCTEAITRGGYWNDVECAASRYYICKTKKIQETTNVPIITPTTPKPDGGGGSGNTGLSGGGITGIVIAVLFVVSAVGLVGYSYIQKKPKQQGFENMSYSGDNSKIASSGDVPIVNVLDGSDA